jgi:MoaA/NifB/PqqE/SkfB family radical SAM enzyme
LSDRKDILSAPIRVYFEITKACNLACKHCFVSADKNAPYGLELGKITKILDDFENNGVIDVRFTGGEPTFRRDWFEIFSHARRNGFSISINTNGVYKNRTEVVRKLTLIEPSQVTVSLDGMRENHDHLRGKGTFDQSVASLKSMREAGLKTRVNTVINQRNVQDISQLVEYCKDFIEEINFFFMRPVGRAIKESGRGNSLTFDSHFQSSVDTLRLRDKYPEIRIMHFEQSFSERTIECHHSLKNALPYGSTTLNVSCDGIAWAHGYLTYQNHDLNLGSLIESSLREVWTSEKLDCQRNWLQAIQKRCHDCPEYKSTCAGYNFEMHIAEEIGSIDKNPFCISDQPMPRLEDFHG